MTPKEKAQKLVDIYLLKGYGVIHESFAKQCALIAVDEILDLKHIVSLRRNAHEMELEFWDEVKQEIELL
jgi:hypothetical protein